jgi:histidinol-phosphate aminotransferase
MYGVCADINDVEKVSVALTPEFQIDVARVLHSIDKHMKLIFICSPNNPTANLMSADDIQKILENTGGLVILDEAYIDFAPAPGWLSRLKEFPNLVILQTFSKAWGMAGIRLGMAFADEAIIRILNRVKPPYNVNQLTQQSALIALENEAIQKNMVVELKNQRDFLKQELPKLKAVQQVFPSDANFILARFKNPRRVYDYLLMHGVIVRDRSREIHCENCLRITVGTAQENQVLLRLLSQFEDTI